MLAGSAAIGSPLAGGYGALMSRTATVGVLEPSPVVGLSLGASMRAPASPSPPQGLHTTRCH